MFEKNGLYWYGTGKDVIKISSVAKNFLLQYKFTYFVVELKFLTMKAPSKILTFQMRLQTNLHHNEKGRRKRDRLLYFSHARETKAKFISLTCHNNPNKQCLVVQSDWANIVIQGSTFYNQSVDSKKSGSCLSLAANINASLRIVNSNFHNNEAGAGGSALVDKH